MSPAAGSLIDRVVRHARDVDFMAIPESVRTIARGLTLDTLGAILQASSPRYPAGQIFMRYARDQGGTAESSIVGGGFKTNAVQAALVNGTLGYYCDVEPHHPGAIMHGLAIVLPTALAVGERANVTGREFMSAIVAGVDMACRVANAIDPTALYRRGMHPSCLAGSFGACTAASRLLGLDDATFRWALGLCGTQASGLLAWETDETEHSRPFNPGIAARNGTTAALLAAHGFGGPPDIFEGRFNIFGAFSERQSDGVWGRPHELTRAIGEDFLITGFAVKLYSCCAFLHPGLDALLSILRTHDLGPGQIRAIDLRFPTNGTKLIDNNELKSHCAQYVLPIAVRDRRVTIDDILHDRRSDAEIGLLASNVRVVADDDLDRTFPEIYATIVEVQTRDGRMFSERVDYARGCPENPVTYDEIVAKFNDLATPSAGAARATAVRSFMDAVEEAPSIRALTDLLVMPTSA